MQYRRWYPTATTLADGRVVVTAGQQYGGPIGTITTTQADIPEIFTPTAGTGGTWQTMDNTAQRRLPTYPWMFQAPDGRVFNAGPNYRTGWLNPTATAIDVTGADKWSDGPVPLWAGGRVPDATEYDYSPRNAGSAVMYLPGKIMVLGGASSKVVTNTTELLDLTQTNPNWQAGPSMRFPRYHVNATLLADGSVLATGGSTQTSSIDAPAVMTTELWTPGASAWQEMAALDVPRLYHSTAVLLPDATVLTTGGGQGAGYPEHHDYQIFTPPYLCQPGVARPVISHAPPAVAYGQVFRVQSPDAARVARATWVRLSSVTHSFNMNQRFLELPMRYMPIADNPGDDRNITVTAPSSATECPPGHYMLFLISPEGVPSLASIMAVSDNACSASLTLSSALTQQSDCQKTYRFTVSNPQNCGTAYRWWVNGTYQPARDDQTFLDYTLSPTLRMANIRAKTLCSCAGATVAAEYTMSGYFPNCSGTGPNNPEQKPSR